MRGRISLILSSWTLVGAALLASGCGAGEAEPAPVTVGVAVPFAGTGVMADARRAWELVLDEVNAAGGVDGRPLEVHELDTPLENADDLQPIADGFTALADQGHRFIISLVSGSALEPMMDAALPRGVLAMSVTSEEPSATMPEYDGLLLRGILSTDRLLTKQAEALQSLGLRSVAIVGGTTAGAADPRHVGMRDAYARCAGCAVNEVTYPTEADLYLYDWDGVAAEVLASDPDVIFLAAHDGAALRDTVRAIDVAGFDGLYYFAYGAFMGPVSASLPASSASQRFRSYDLAPPPSEQLDAFSALYASRYSEALVPEPRLIAFADYLALLALAVGQVGDHDAHEVSRAMREIAGPPGEAYGPMEYEAAVAALRAGRDIDFAGLSGSFDFDARGDVADGFILEYGVTAAGEVTALP